MNTAAFCRDTAQLFQDEKTAAVKLTTLRAFRYFLQRCCPYELREIAIVAFFDWLERGGNPNDADIGRLNVPKTRSTPADVTDDSPVHVQLDAIRHTTVVVNREFVSIAELVRPRSR
jgi:hypothetical protein